MSVMQRHTPETDEAEDRCNICNLNFVSAEHARALERDRNRLREALAELLACHVPGASGSRTHNAREAARAALEAKK